MQQTDNAQHRRLLLSEEWMVSTIIHELKLFWTKEWVFPQSDAQDWSAFTTNGIVL